MYQLTQNTKIDFSNLWKEKYANFLENEHWQFFVYKFNEYLENDNIPLSLPYFDEEVTPSINDVMNYFKSEYENQNISSWSTIIEDAPFDYLLIILGQRQTSASIKNEIGIPPSKDILLKSCEQLYKQQLCVVTRAWEKHVGRSDDNFWGEIKGSVVDKNVYVKNLVLKLIEEKTWWNIFYHYKHGLVYEIRVKSGHGVRWNKEGTTIIGFLEPFINDHD